MRLISASRRMYFYFKKKLFLLVLLSGGIFLVSAFGITVLEGAKERPAIMGKEDRYVSIEKTPSKLPSRRWMADAITISRKERFSPPRAARLYAYVASLYDEVLEKNNDATEAGDAVSKFLYMSSPKYANDAEVSHGIRSPSNKRLSLKAEEILQRYREREKSDRADLLWDRKTPTGAFWHPRGYTLDDGAMAGEWQTWIVRKAIQLPSPPQRNSLHDTLDLKKLTRALDNRGDADEETIFFWDGAGTTSSASRGNTTIAALWQNILYAEEGNILTDAAYARKQKILAQGLADVLIFVWKTKYAYLRERPSMRIPKLNSLVQDPPYPGFVSEHTAASAAASLILTALIPEKKSVWERQENNAAAARFLSGAEFESDIIEGEKLGTEIARIIREKTVPGASTIPVFKNNLCDNEFCAWEEFIIFAFRDAITKAIETITERTSSGFNNTFRESGIRNESSLGVAWIDYNSDGNPDLFLDSNLYRNNGDGTFTNVTDKAGLGSIHAAYTAFADYDNDGCLDIYVPRYGSEDSAGTRDGLYHNNCNGTFSDVTQRSGIKDMYHGYGAAWADYNNDGFADLYVANWGVHADGAYVFEPNILYKNNGDGTFTNVTKIAHVEGFPHCPKLEQQLGGSYKKKFASRLKPAYQPIWFDYNNDMKPDLFVATDTFLSPLYRNNGDGTFTDVTEEAGLCKLGTGMGVAVGDYDNDGFLDLYVTNTGKNYLWHNNGNGTFSEIAEHAGVADTGQGWGTGFFDYDNDGFLDLYVTNGASNRQEFHQTQTVVKRNNFDELFRNNGNRTFTAVTKRSGIVGNDVKRGAAFGDYNNDGFTDVYVATSDADVAESRLYQNKTNRNHWLKIELMGTISNRNAIGARIKVTTDGFSQIREITAGDSFLSQSSFLQIFGLGKYTSVNALEVTWPSGIRTRILNVRADQKITLIEKKI